jgi:hypothetical protein
LSETQLEELVNHADSFSTYNTQAANKIIDDFEQGLKPAFNEIFKLTNSQPIKDLSGNKIKLVMHEGQYKVLLIIDEDFVSNSSLNVVEDVYVTLSKLVLTPLVLKHGRLKFYDIEFLYLLTDYVPLTLSQIEAGPFKNELLKRALVIIYAIHGMGYCNQDLHDENFLYDNLNDRVYAIDFTDIMLCTESNEQLKDTFHLADLDRRVTFQEIINGVY